MNPPSEFWDQIEAGHDGGCWIWAGTRYSNGYGKFYLRGRHTRRVRGSHVLTHRFAYQCLVGEIPEGLVIDHLCGNRACVNPQHMEPVTQRENLARGATISAYAASRTHCPQNHPYDDANTRYTRQGHRLCKACQAAYQRVLRRRLRDEGTSADKRYRPNRSRAKSLL